MLTKELLEEELKKENIKCNILEFEVLDKEEMEDIAQYWFAYSFIEGYTTRKKPPRMSVGEYDQLIGGGDFNDDDSLIQAITEIEMTAEMLGIDTSKFQKKIAMIAQPANVESYEKTEVRKRATAILEKNSYEVADNPTASSCDDEELKEKRIGNICLYYETKFLECMARCHTVYFCKGWETCKRCRILHKVAKEYDLEMIYE